MKKYLLMFGLFLLFASNAQAFTCYNGFELSKDAHGTEYCEYKSEFNDYPSCHTADPDVDMYWDMATQKCVRCHPFYYSCEVRGYYEDGTTLAYGIKDCGEKFLYCQSCNRKKCTICLLGFTLQDNKCVREVVCPSNCLSCSSSSTCTACKSGYTLKNGQCVKPCPANCATCDSSGVCTKCNGGYKLKNGACEAGSVISCPDDMTLSADGCCCVAG